MVPELNTPDRASPQHEWFGEQIQYRAKLRRFSNSPPEITVQQVSFERDFQRYRNAYDRGQTSCFNRARTGRPATDAPRSDESLERSQRRAKTGVRLLVTELAPTALVTFTTRETMPLDDLLKVWQRFCALMRQAGIDFEYVAVPERHPTNPSHFHLHVAYRGRTKFDNMRRFWHMALEARHGRRVLIVLRGVESPGNVDVQRIKSRCAISAIRKIARYISKYITKDMISEFNRKRYWPSKGITLIEAERFWLSGLTQLEAIKEACQMFGLWHEGVDFCPQKIWMPGERFAYIVVDPSLLPPAPF